MSVYTNNIIFGVLSFPFIALIITLPYLLYQYRKFGSVPWFRTFVVYSFIFYLLCAYYMVILPLPLDRSAFVPYAATPQIVPFSFIGEIAGSTHFSLTHPLTWLQTLRNPFVYQALFNVVLTVPFGMYLRYYFRCSWLQTFLLGFAFTLFFEVSQITGLFGLYEHPYRLFDVDDLILNTLGAMVGFWLVGPVMRALPDIRLVNEEAREAGLRAGALKRSLSFLIDVALTLVLAGGLAKIIATFGLLSSLGTSPSTLGGVKVFIFTLSCLVFFVVVPTLTRGQTLGQKWLKLCIVMSDIRPAHWYNYIARYGLLYLLVVAPLVIAFDMAPIPLETELGVLAGHFGFHRQELLAAWFVAMALWAISLIVRAIYASVKGKPFIMLNGLLSNTRVMTCAEVEIERERRLELRVEEVVKLERLIAEDGIPPIELMHRAGVTAAKEVRIWVPDPAPVVVLTGNGNNGGDGWVCAYALAEAGYSVTIVAPDLAERLQAEPARTTALQIFSEANAHNRALRVLIAPDEDILSNVLDSAHAIVDALLGTGFSHGNIREPYASWITAANRRRFEGSRVRGQGKHRKRTHARSAHEQSARRDTPLKVRHAPFALAVDVPSGLAAQTGSAANPTFAADVTVTMLAFKPGLTSKSAKRWTGVVKLAKLVDTKPYLEQLLGQQSLL